MTFWCEECKLMLGAEELVDNEDEDIADDICCPYCKTAIPELDPLNNPTSKEG